MRKRSKKTGKFISVLDDAAYIEIDKRLKEGRGTNGITQWLVKEYGLNIIYAYNVVIKRKRRLEMVTKLMG